jgi:hypothetical protein
MTSKNLPEKTPTLDLISGAAGAWQRGYDAGRKSGSTYAALVWGVIGFILGTMTMGILR